jgi:predicted nucleic acid-binding protein
MIAIDSNVIVAALAPWHERHEAAAAAVEKALSSRAGVVIPAHALLEAYSVLTRLPEPYRARGLDVADALQRTFSSATIAGFPVKGVWEMLADLASNDIAGGSVYDAAILRTAESAGATSLLTFNARDFERFSSQVRVRVP